MTDVPEPTPADDLPEVTPEPAAPARRKRALWGVLAVLAVGVGAVAVRAADDDAARVPVTLGSNEGAAPAADMALRANVHYVAGPDLPDLGGRAAAYRLPGDVDRADVDRIAKALDISGSPKQADGTWHLQDGNRTLDVYSGAGARWAYGSGEAGKVGFASTASSGASTSAASPPCVGGPAVDCGPVDEPTTTTVPADLPTAKDAQVIAVELLEATGMDTEGADVRVEGPYDSWFVTVTPSISGRTANELGGTVNVGSKGVVQFASGVVGDVESVGDVDVVDTRAAIDRLNEGTGGGWFAYAPGTAEADTTQVDSGAGTCAETPDGRESCTYTSLPPCPVDGSATTLAVPPDTPVASDGATEVAPAGPACGPVPMPVDLPEPIEVVLTGVEQNLMLLPASDGSTDGYLVPGYHFTSDDGAEVDQVAIAEDALAPVDITPEPQPAPYPGAKCAAVEGGPDGVSGDVCVDPNSVVTTIPGDGGNSSSGSGKSGSTPGGEPTMSIPPNESITPVEPTPPCTLPEPGPNGEVPLIGCADPGDVPVQP